MKILVLGGSPKGETSVTMQYVRWIAENLPNHEVRTLQIASRIGALERDDGKFAQAIEAVNGGRRGTVGLPPLRVHGLLAVQALHRADLGARGRRAPSRASTPPRSRPRSISSTIRRTSTSARSPKTSAWPLPAPSRRRWTICGRASAGGSSSSSPRASPRQPRRRLPHAPAERSPADARAAPRLRPRRRRDRGRDAGSEAGGKKILVLVDYPELAVGAMARRFAGAVSARGTKVEILALEEMGMKGGCLGCLKCGQANRCAYEGKDGFIDAFRSKVQTADLLVFAGTTRDRALSARWKAFLDRAFFNTHQRSEGQAVPLHRVGTPLEARQPPSDPPGLRGMAGG